MQERDLAAAFKDPVDSVDILERLAGVRRCSSRIERSQTLERASRTAERTRQCRRRCGHFKPRTSSGHGRLGRSAVGRRKHQPAGIRPNVDLEGVRTRDLHHSLRVVFASTAPPADQSETESAATWPSKPEPSLRGAAPAKYADTDGATISCIAESVWKRREPRTDRSPARDRRGARRVRRRHYES